MIRERNRKSKRKIKGCEDHSWEAAPHQNSNVENRLITQRRDNSSIAAEVTNVKNEWRAIVHVTYDIGSANLAALFMSQTS